MNGLEVTTIGTNPKNRTIIPKKIFIAK